MLNLLIALGFLFFAFFQEGEDRELTLIWAAINALVGIMIVLAFHFKVPFWF